jgi:hypothetical protein
MAADSSTWTRSRWSILAYRVPRPGGQWATSDRITNPSGGAWLAGNGLQLARTAEVCAAVLPRRCRAYISLPRSSHCHGLPHSPRELRHSVGDVPKTPALLGNKTRTPRSYIGPRLVRAGEALVESGTGLCFPHFFTALDLSSAANRMNHERLSGVKNLIDEAVIANAELIESGEFTRQGLRVDGV